ncbi:alanine dehydrogenase [Kangiella aquimarina]|uniref:Alanine dehydrogenase n=1 Tax=Kangiella aquimarina TaxID=261965 RepID=A0ABZ0X244_9GAMM|nr:alanine dehydrogenase [Kangiella aquimarina]WQG84595.1 alanine dehydrogenase [Kangiella aquimarina]
MLIGVPKEIKNHEYRVGMVPASVREVIAHGHEVIVETNAGIGIGFTDEDYQAVGATIAPSAEDVFAKADMIVKVKEPLAEERKRLREGQILFTYLHLAPDMPQTEDLVKSGAVCIAYETVTSAAGGLPLLAPMSEVAGRMSIQAGAECLEKSNGGRGMLLGGVPGVQPAKVVVIGGGVVGTNAIKMAVGMGARVIVLDRNVNALRRIDAEFGSQVETVYSSHDSLEKHVISADLVIGGVLIPGAAAPKLVTEEMVKRMQPGAVLVDVAIDQGGCFETSKATTHADPTYILHDVVHYCVANMPGAVPRTSTFALNNATLPFIINIANKGYKKALADDPHLLNGLNVYRGKVTERSVAENLGFDYVEPTTALGISTDTL